MRERGDLGRGLEKIGHHDDVEAGGVGGADAGVGILERVAGGGVDAQAAHGLEEDVGFGFAARDLVAGDDDNEIFEQADRLEPLRGDGVARGSGDGEWNFARGKIAEQFEDAGLEREAVALDDFLEENAGGGVDALEIEAGAEVLAHEIAGIALGAADHEREYGVGHLVAGGARRFLPRDPRDALSVDHEAVHVEDDAGIGGHKGRVYTIDGTHLSRAAIALQW